MNILYILHAFPWNEHTGSTLILDNYVKQALFAGLGVSIMVPDTAFKHTEHCGYGNSVSLYRFRSQDNWGVSGFDFDLIKNDVPVPNLNIVPDLVHIIDWVNFHPSLFPFLGNLGCPIVRSVCNFEEFCPMTTPVFYSACADTCRVPLSTDQCLDCVSDNHNLSVPGATYIYKELMSALVTYRKNYRDGMLPLLSQRSKFVRSLYKNYVDYVVFPSQNFAQYFLAQLQQNSLKHKVIPHGLGVVDAKPMRASTLPIKIIYTGGDRVAKGWDVLAAAIEILARTQNPHFELHCVGNAQGIPEHYFENANIKLVRCRAYASHEVERILDSFDIAIAPSHFESYGLFVRECVRARVVPVVTPSMGVSEFIAQGENGFQLEKPYAENLAKLILELTNDAHALTELRAELDVASLPTAASEFAELHDLYSALILRS